MNAEPPVIPPPAMRRRHTVTLKLLFIAGLLDVTDNLVDGRAVPPPQVVLSAPASIIATPAVAPNAGISPTPPPPAPSSTR